jgi:alkanesulfonate monooxygenase SsuD/methylene tetrahydromethanopterin reductase-like flavin-dependent oxidoreductase (luciferase family)
MVAGMKVGITLPQFGDEADTALEGARRAEALGIDGVFCFDHLWPIGQPDRPALSSGPLLGAVAASTSTISLGTLVARIGLLPDEILVAVLSSLSVLSKGRFIAGIGTGDHLSRPENDAFGLPFEAADARRARLLRVASAVQGKGIPVWVGGGVPKTVELARTVGAAVNLWDGNPLQVAELTAVGIEVTWGGPVGKTLAEATAHLEELAAAGATWAVSAWPESLEVIAGAAEAVRSAT